MRKSSHKANIGFNYFWNLEEYKSTLLSHTFAIPSTFSPAQTTFTMLAQDII